MATGCGNLYITVGLEDGKPFEVFATLGKSGGCSACFTVTLTKSISQGIRHGVPTEEYIKLLIGSSCPNTTWQEGKPILSCPDAIGQALREVNDAYTKTRKQDNPNPPSS